MSTDVMLIGSVVHNIGRSLASGWVVHGTSKISGTSVHLFILCLFKISGSLSPQRGTSGVDKATAGPEARNTHVRSPQTYMQVTLFCIGVYSDQIPYFRQKTILWIPVVRSESNFANKSQGVPIVESRELPNCLSTLLQGRSSACGYRARSPVRYRA
jgi:hypothetical protein